MDGLFITFEGVDGSGKTTVSKAVYDKLKKDNIDCIYTREPGGIEIAEKIRDLILDPQNTMMDPKTEALLYAASRRQHLVENVIPALNKGKLVICDRFVDSSLAYQGFGRNLGFNDIKKINEFAIEGLYPKATIFLDLNEEEGLKRISNRVFKDRLDQESLEFHNQVALGYKFVKDAFKERMVVIDASQSLEEVINEAYNKILNIINDC